MDQLNMSREMLERLSLNQLPAPALTDFDNSDAAPDTAARALAHRDQDMHKDVLLIALLEGWCQVKGKSLNKSKRLYKKMCGKLMEMKMISPVFLETVRRSKPSFTLLLNQLVSLSLSSSSGEDSINGQQRGAVVPFQLRSLLRTADTEMASYFPQRYEKDFEEIERIGLGGFGKVYRACNRLDKKDYAIKKIKVKQKKPNFMAMQREIQTLAGLNHPNIVRYHTSWFGEEERRIKQSKRRKHYDFTSAGNKYRSYSRVRQSKVDADEEEEDDNDDDDDEWDAEGEEDGEGDENAEVEEVVIEALENPHKMRTEPVITEYHEEKLDMQITTQSHISEPLNDIEDSFEVIFEDERFDSGEMVDSFFEETQHTVHSTNLKSERVTLSESTSKITTHSKTVNKISSHFESTSTLTSHLESTSEKSSTSESASTITSVTSHSESTSTITSHHEGFHHTNNRKGHSHNHKGSSKLPSTDHRENDNNNHASLSDEANICEELDITKKQKKSCIISSIVLVDDSVRTKSPFFPQASNSITHMPALPSGQSPRSFRRSVSWDGSDCSPQSAQRAWSPLLYEKCQFLYIQMELCCSNLHCWMLERNKSVGDQQKQFDVVKDNDNKVIMKQILEGMSHIHSNGILHRDVTPKNIFLDGGDGSAVHVKIGDFGLAREDSSDDPKTPLATKKPGHDCSIPCGSKCHTSGVGTTTYASPEQLNGSMYDNKSDMYSVGLIFFEMYHPFETQMERDICLRKLREGDIPDEIKKRWPAVYSAIQQLTCQDSHERPSADKLLRGGLFPSKDEIITEKENEIQRLRALLADRDAEILTLKNSKPRNDPR